MFDKILEFITAHYELIFSVFLCFTSLIISLFKKKPVKVCDTLKQFIADALPGFINKAENSGLKGSDKLNLVLEYVDEFLKSYGFEFTDYYKNYVIKQIENILTTPTKK